MELQYWIEWRNAFRFEGCFFRMSQEDFENLVCLSGPAVNKKNTNFGNAISVMECLEITLKSLAAGDLYHSIMYLFIKFQHSQYR